MIAVDTNVLARFITNDDAAQAKRARRLIEAGPVFVAKTVLLELEWVPRGAYGLDRSTILKAVRCFLGFKRPSSCGAGFRGGVSDSGVGWVER